MVEPVLPPFRGEKMRAIRVGAYGAWVDHYEFGTQGTQRDRRTRCTKGFRKCGTRMWRAGYRREDVRILWTQGGPDRTLTHGRA
jgi:hypothetical protein